MTVTAIETLTVTGERDARLHRHDARPSAISGTLETRETSHHVISMLDEHAVILAMDPLRQASPSQILLFWALALLTAAVELGEDEVVEILGDAPGPSTTTIATDIMIPEIAR